jgi:hypothetical protein
VLNIHLPFHESDHVLAQALSLYVGGECLEDQAALQHDERLDDRAALRVGDGHRRGLHHGRVLH